MERRYEIVLCRRECDQLTLEMLADAAETHPGLVERLDRDNQRLRAQQ